MCSCERFLGEAYCFEVYRYCQIFFRSRDSQYLHRCRAPPLPDSFDLEITDAEFTEDRHHRNLRSGWIVSLIEFGVVI